MPVNHASYDHPVIIDANVFSGDRVLFDAVLFDMGGVLVTGPFTGFARYELDNGLPVDTIRSINATNADANAWARYERGEIGRDDFCGLYASEAASLGFAVDGDAVLQCMKSERVDEMIELVGQLRGRFKLGMITNNLHPMRREDSMIADVLEAFDVIIESSVEGVRKPDPAIYRLACDRLGVAAARCVFLDDLGVNLKPARAIGMTTIKVIDPVAATTELAAL
ncbi:MAG: HAD-IA family hydrolase, partial [Acidimicrobiales bacterium]